MRIGGRVKGLTAGRALAPGTARLLVGVAVCALTGAPVFLAGTSLAQTAEPQIPTQPGVRSFNILAQPLTGALTQFGRQSGLQVAFPTEVPRGLRSNAVVGVFTPQQALARLTQGTGVSYRITSEGTVIITAPQTANDAGAGAIDTGDDTVLEPIVISGKTGRYVATGSGYQGTPDWVYQEPASVSVVSREAIQGSGGRNTRDLFNNISGVYAGEGNGSFPTVSPNIRGLQDAGRVVVSIDGARHNAQRGLGFGGSDGGYQSDAGQAYVDTAFIRSVEVEKSTDASSGNVGSLGGSVDFRTVGADDLIRDGKNWGIELNAARGDNAYDFQGSILGAARLGDTPFSVTGGYSRTRLGEYEIGANGDSTTTEETMRNQLGRESWSSLVKLEGDFGDVQTSLSWMHQENEFLYGSSGGTSRNFEDVRNDSVSAELKWDPESDLIDFTGRFWFNDAMNNEMREARDNGTPDTFIDAGMKSFGGSLENTSRFDTPAGALSVNYGAEAFRDITTSSASSATIDLNPDWASNYTSFSPDGRRDMASFFINGALEPADWVTLRAGLRYDWSRLKGTSTYYNRYSYTEVIEVPCDPLSNHYTAAQYYDSVIAVGSSNPPPRAIFINVLWPNSFASRCMAGTGPSATQHNPVTVYPSYDVEIDRTDDAWLPSASIEFKPADWFRPFVTYSHSFRPPTILETFFSGGTPGDGAPGTVFAPNEWLKPERARTAEIGANILLDDLLQDGDSLRLKAAAFYREVDDYIVLGSILTPGVTDRSYYGFVNYDGTTTMRGVELEGNYNTDRFWLGGSMTFLDTEWPEKTQVFSNGSITTDGEVFATSGAVAPRFKVTLDAGLRFFETRLSIGGRLTHVTPTQSRSLDEDGNLREISDPYTVADIYASYALTESATLKLAVNNVTDRNYIPATSSYTAPGRTFLASLNMRF